MMRPAKVFRKPSARVISWLLYVCAVVLMGWPAQATVGVSLVWDPSTDPGTTGYKIYYGTASHVYTTSVDVGRVTNATVTVPAANTAYYFAATTYDVLGTESDFSNEAILSVAAPTVFLPPKLAAINSVTINQNAGSQVISLSGISPGTGAGLNITASSSNPALVPNPAVNYVSPNTGGSLTFAPAKNMSGTATIMVTANNGMPQGNLVTQTFTVNVAAVFQPPTLAVINNLSINENAGWQTVNLSGIGLGTGAGVGITASSSNPALVPNPVVSYASPNAGGSLMFAPAKNMFGTATITVTANNGLSKNNLSTRTFTVGVAQVFQPPALPALNSISINENAGPQAIGLNGISQGTGPTLSITASSSNPALITNLAVTCANPFANGCLAFTPVKNMFGTATITLTANNGLSRSNLSMRTFTLTIRQVNQPPTLNLISNLALGYNPAVQVIRLGGISTGAANEKQRLVVTAVSGNPQLVPSPIVGYASPNTSGTLTFRPVVNASGTAVITVTVNDGGTSNNIVTRQFTVSVAPPATPATKPVVLNRLPDSVALAGKTVTLKVSAAGRSPLKYQWKYNGVTMPGATGPVLTLKTVSLDQAGMYSVTVANDMGTTDSAPATLMVTTTPAATLSAPAAAGANGSFSFGVAGVTGYNYAVQASTDFVHWTAIQTNTAPFNFTDTNSSQFGKRFYRTVYLP